MKFKGIVKNDVIEKYLFTPPHVINMSYCCICIKTLSVIKTVYIVIQVYYVPLKSSSCVENFTALSLQS